MRISKFVHSCLLIEEEKKTILIDSGIYSIQEKALTLDQISKLDYLLLTHEHPDHMDVKFIKQLYLKFPKIQILSNQSVAEILKKENLKVSTQSTEFISIQNAPHEHIFGTDKVFKNSLFIVNNKLTHPGDSQQFSSTTEILALPMQAPWGNTTELIEFGLKLKPKKIIPIHDWHWRVEAREALYQRAKEFYKKNGIEFYGVEQGFVVEV